MNFYPQDRFSNSPILLLIRFLRREEFVELTVIRKFSLQKTSSLKGREGRARDLSILFSTPLTNWPQSHTDKGATTIVRTSHQYFLRRYNFSWNTDEKTWRGFHKSIKFRGVSRTFSFIFIIWFYSVIK